ncbi:2-phospho-L-lactate guanylyltransferase [Archaeoglobus sp.]
MLVLIPFKPVNPKTRLRDVMSRTERENFARCMLLDVLNALSDFDCDIKILSTHPFQIEGYEVVVDGRELDEAINSRIKEETAVIMSDIPLISPETLRRFFESEGDVVVAPGRKGGTNMILIRNTRFRVKYYYCSFLRHLESARDLGLNPTVFDSFYASVDIDTPDDLLELMIHGKGKKSYEFLHSIGFRIKYEREPKLVRISNTSP